MTADAEAPVRCWPTSDPLYIAYHDEEWGRPVRDEHRLLERLCLEGFQSGLAWITILRKREGFRAAFDDFRPDRVARFGDGDVERLMGDPGIVRNRAKIEAAIANARATVALHDAGETLDALLWSFAPDAPAPAPRTLQDMPASTPESAALARELKRRGFRFVGPTTAYALMQATGIVNDHLEHCVVRASVEADRVASRTLRTQVPGGGEMANATQDVDEQADAATMGAPRHGIAGVRGQDGVPLSPLHEGRFGRLFRDPQPLRPDDGALNALAKLVRESGSAAAGDNAKIPAGYTYLGQFIDHDLTFDPVSDLQKDNDPDALVDFRTPRFDLDCLYGSGPDDDAFMYEWSSPTNRGVKLLVGRNPTASGEFDRDDLPRNQQGRALIGDPRNDENIIVSQLQLLFIRFHNKVVDRTRKNQRLSGAALFKEAQRIARWHYQWIVVHDFLERIVGKQTAQVILKPGTPASPAATTELNFFNPKNNPFMPVEFSGAAYRFGHSQVRASYDLNEIVTGVPIFAAADKPGPLEHLGGFRRLPAVWTIDWSLYFKTSASASPQLSRKIDTSIAAPLFRLPGLPGKRPALPLLNLRRGRALGLPSGQDVAAAMGAPPLTTAQLGLGKIDLPPEDRAQLERATPLWFYLLREAAVLGKGERLGMVGGRIVAEVLVGLLAGDPQSYLSRKPTWTPILPAAKKGDFTMADLVRFTLG